MAERAVSISDVTPDIVTMTWTGLANGDTGAPAGRPEYADRTVQVYGTFDSGSVTIEGTCGGNQWATLTDPQGNALTFSSGRIEAITENVLQVRPSSSGGASMSCTVVMVGRRNQK